MCQHPGCGKLINSPGRCEVHAKAKQQADQQQRGTAHERGYTSAWVKARAGYLRLHPLCGKCQERGQLVPATVVDHIVPHRLKAAMDSGDEVAIARAKALFWDKTNWQSMCKPDHDAKTAKEDGGFGRATVNRQGA